MSNILYDKAREKFLTGGINWMSMNIKAVLVDTSGYTPNFATNEYLSDIGASYRTSPCQPFANKNADGGAADAGDIEFASVAAPTTYEAIVIYVDTGDSATSSLIAYIDTATGLPITANGGNIIVTWDNGVNKIFKL